MIIPPSIGIIDLLLRKILLFLRLTLLAFPCLMIFLCHMSEIFVFCRFRITFRYPFSFISCIFIPSPLRQALYFVESSFCFIYCFLHSYYSNMFSEKPSYFPSPYFNIYDFSVKRLLPSWGASMQQDKDSLGPFLVAAILSSSSLQFAILQ